MSRPMRCLVLSFVLSISAAMPERQIPAGSKIFIDSMDVFETYLKAALDKKKVTLSVVDDVNKADFEISGTAYSREATKAKKIISANWRSTEEAAIAVTDRRTGVVVFAYSVFIPSSQQGRRSTAEACAKHLKEQVTAVSQSGNGQKIGL